MVSTCKCPNCDAPIEFDSSTQKMTCEYCGNEMTVDEAQAQLKNFKVEVEDKTDNVYENIDMEVYVCSTCGAEVLTDEHTSATFCSYCGNPTLIRNRFEGVLSPAYVIPFKVSKEAAKNSYKAWINKGGLFTPKEFKSEAVLDKITGLYAPFWLYDCTGQATIHAVGKKVNRRREGQYMCTYTSIYDVHRDFSIGYEKLPADASEKLPDYKMDLLEPFDYSQLQPFKLPYISGYYADKYKYTSDEMSRRIEDRLDDYIVTAGRNTITGYSSVSIGTKNIKITKDKADYVLLPVWILSYKYKDKMYSFMMNGQTGKIVADRPKSNSLMWGWFFGLAGGLFAAMMAVGFLLGLIVI